MDPAITIRPRFGLILTVVIALIVVSCMVSFVVVGDTGNLRAFGGGLTVIVWLTWVGFWRPRVVIGPTSVDVHNPFTDFRIPWGDIESLDTRFGLRLATPHGRISAWGAPAPGARRMVPLSRHATTDVSMVLAVDGRIRPSDITATDSGEAAAIIMRVLDRETLPTSDAPFSRRANIAVIAVTIVLIAAAALVAIV